MANSIVCTSKYKQYKMNDFVPAKGGESLGWWKTGTMMEGISQWWWNWGGIGGVKHSVTETIVVGATL